MDPSITLPNGIIVEQKKDNYYFYYKPIPGANPNKKTRKEYRYKCFLHAALYSSQRLQIHNLDCKGRGQGKGDGKLVLCTALNYLKSELGLQDETVVSLTAMSLEKANPRESQDRLIGYYNRLYGFEVVSEDQVLDMYRTDMATTIKTVIDKCTIVAAPPQKRTMRQKMGNLFGSLRRRLTGPHTASDKATQ